MYDSGLRLYVVSGHANIYYSDDRYYRLRHGVWESTTHFQGNWRRASSKSLPPGLQSKHVAKGKKKK